MQLTGSRVLGGKVTVLRDEVLALTDGAVVARGESGTVGGDEGDGGRGVAPHGVAAEDGLKVLSRLGEVGGVLGQGGNEAGNGGGAGVEGSLGSGIGASVGAGSGVGGHDLHAGPELADLNVVGGGGEEGGVHGVAETTDDGHGEDSRGDGGALHDVVAHDLPDLDAREKRLLKIIPTKEATDAIRTTN